jgi:hypothetical protein
VLRVWIFFKVEVRPMIMMLPLTGGVVDPFDAVMCTGPMDADSVSTGAPLHGVREPLPSNAANLGNDAAERPRPPQTPPLSVVSSSLVPRVLSTAPLASAAAPPPAHTAVAAVAAVAHGLLGAVVGGGGGDVPGPNGGDPGDGGGLSGSVSIGLSGGSPGGGSAHNGLDASARGPVGEVVHAAAAGQGPDAVTARAAAEAARQAAAALEAGSCQPSSLHGQVGPHTPLEVVGGISSIKASLSCSSKDSCASFHAIFFRTFFSIFALRSSTRFFFFFFVV